MERDHDATGVAARSSSHIRPLVMATLVAATLTGAAIAQSQTTTTAPTRGRVIASTAGEDGAPDALTNSRSTSSTSWTAADQSGALDDVRAYSTGINRQLVSSSVRQVGENISFRETDGTITLVGEVPSADDKRHAERTVRAVPGVTRVINRLRVRPVDDYDAGFGIWRWDWLIPVLLGLLFGLWYLGSQSRKRVDAVVATVGAGPVSELVRTIERNREELTVQSDDLLALRGDLSDRRRDLLALERQISGREATANQAAMELEMVRFRLESKDRDVSRLENDVRNLDEVRRSRAEALGEAERGAQERDPLIPGLEMKVVESERTVTALGAQLEPIRFELIALRARLRELRETEQRLQREVSGREEQGQGLEDQLRSRENEQRELELRVAQLTESLDQQRKVVREERDALAKRTREESELTARHAPIESRFQVRQQELARANARLTELTPQALEQRLAATRAQTVSVNADLRVLEQRETAVAAKLGAREEELDGVSNASRELRRVLKSSRQRFASLRVECDGLRARLRQLEGQQSEAEAELRTTSRRLQERTVSARELDDKLNVVGRSIAGRQAKIADIRQQIDRLEASLKTLATQIDASESRQSTVRESTVRLGDDNERLGSELDDLNTRIAESQEGIRGREERIRVLENDYDAATAAAAEVESKLSAIRKTATIRAKRLTDVRKLIDKLLGTNDANRSKVETGEADQHKLHERIAQLADDSERVTSQTTVIDNRVAEQTRVNGRLEELLEKSTAELNDALKGVTEVEAELDGLRKTAASRQLKIDELNKLIATTEKSLETSRKKLEQTHAQRAALEESNALLGEDNERLESECRVVADKLRAAEARTVELRDRLSSVEAAAAEAAALRDRLIADRQGLRDDLAAVKAELATLGKALTTTSKSIGSAEKLFVAKEAEAIELEQTIRDLIDALEERERALSEATTRGKQLASELSSREAEARKLAKALGDLDGRLAELRKLVKKSESEHSSVTKTLQVQRKDHSDLKRRLENMLARLDTARKEMS